MHTTKRSNERKRVLRITPIDFACPPGWLIGGLTTPQALGFYRWLVLGTPIDERPALNQGQTPWHHWRPCSPLDISTAAVLQRQLHRRLHFAVVMGDRKAHWRKAVRLHESQVMDEHRLFVRWWAGDIDWRAVKEFIGSRLPFAPNPIHKRARTVKSIGVHPTSDGWDVTIGYGFKSEGSEWFIEQRINGARISLASGLTAIMDDMASQERAELHASYHQAWELRPPLAYPLAVRATDPEEIRL